MTACERCGKQWRNGTCDTTPGRRGLCVEEVKDQLYLSLKGARERLCKAQMHLPTHWRTDVDTVIHIIDTIGSSVCPQQWSSFDQPEYPEALRP